MLLTDASPMLLTDIDSSRVFHAHEPDVFPPAVRGPSALVLERLVKIESDKSVDEMQVVQLLKDFETDIKSTLLMYIDKTTDKVLDTSNFPSMNYRRVGVETAESQEDRLHFGKRTKKLLARQVQVRSLTKICTAKL